jgi:hypothetical protein
MVVVTDHDSKVLARKTFRCRAWDLGAALDWASRQASSLGFAGVTVACEPTGHRWRVLGQLAGERGMPFVCVQPMLTSWARRSEDLTFDKTDEKDAVIIARLTAQLRCYVPEPIDETWGRLRHLGARRVQLLVESGSQVQQMRALLECVWPAALQTARQPFRSLTWTAAMSVVQRDGGDLTRTRSRPTGAAQYRVLFQAGAKEKLLHRANRFALAGTLILGVAMVAALLLILDFLFARSLAIVACVAVAALLLWAWQIQPAITRARSSKG